MPRMIKELYRHPELGFIHAEMWFSRTIILLQYWRSMEQLLAYAKLARGVDRVDNMLEVERNP